MIGEATAAFTIAKALPNAYNLDLQEITPHLWRALDDATSSVSLMARMLPSARFDAERLKSAVDEDMSTATELANDLVHSHRLPFRQAHQIVGELVRIAVEKKIGLEEATEESLGEVSRESDGPRDKD